MKSSSIFKIVTYGVSLSSPHFQIPRKNYVLTPKSYSLSTSSFPYPYRLPTRQARVEDYGQTAPPPPKQMQATYVMKGRKGLIDIGWIAAEDIVQLINAPLVELDYYKVPALSIYCNIRNLNTYCPFFIQLTRTYFQIVL